MKNYVVLLSPEAEEDINDLYQYIAYNIKEPVTAIRYRNGIYDAIKNLGIIGGALAVSQRPYIQKRYGPDAKTVTYKKMTIIFNVTDTVLVRRVVASSLIL